MYNIKGEIMDELVKNQDPEKTTPEDATAPVVAKVEQPTTVVPDPKLKELETRLQEMEAREKRHKEQLVGKDKQINELKIKKLANSFQPVNQEQITEPVIEEEPKPVARETRQLETDVTQAIYINKAIMKDEFGEDPTIPWTKEVSSKVEEVLDQLDPSGKTKIHPDAWRSAFKIYRGDVAESIIRQREDQLRAEFSKKEVERAESFVAPVTPPQSEKVGPTLDDVINGKIKMTAREILENFPELRTQVSKGTLKEYGLI